MIGGAVAEALFPDGNAVGQVVRVNNVPFRVVGVLERKGGTTMGTDQDDQLVAPYTTVMKRVMGTTRISIIYVAAVSPDAVARAQEEIEALLRQRHRIAEGQPSDFMMRSQEEIASRAAQSSRTMSLLLGSVAAISLLVGGIGIMNIMLVSVTERTREIGVRLAVGAKARHILLQFLLEAVILSVVGGGARRAARLRLRAGSSPSSRAGRRSSASARSAWPSASPPWSGSSSASTRRAGRRGSTRSKPCVTSELRRGRSRRGTRRARSIAAPGLPQAAAKARPRRAAQARCSWPLARRPGRRRGVR